MAVRWFSPSPWGDDLRHRNKITSTTTAGRMMQAQGWFDSPCYYVSIAYGGSEMGLLVRTDDEKTSTSRSGQALYQFRRHGENAVGQEGLGPMREDRDQMKPSFFQIEPEVDAGSVEERGPMPFAETRYSRYLFQRESILKNAPESPAFTVSSTLSGSTSARLTTCARGSSNTWTATIPASFVFSPRDSLSSTPRPRRAIAVMSN